MHTSAAGTPSQRGEEFGATNAEAIATTIARYRELFAAAGCDADGVSAGGSEALEVIADFSSEAEAEIRGIAHGAGVPPRQIAALNARTEILGRFGVHEAECSTVVSLPPDGGDPLTIQTWDWHDSFKETWLVWSIEHPDGRVVHTLTEYGILGKIGVNSRGVGIHLNLLAHASDGGKMGVPVHTLARAVLDRTDDPGAAAALVGAARVSASSAITLVGASPGGTTAASAELSPAGARFVLPSECGLLVRTNHFLDPHLAAGDQAPSWGPDSYLRLDVLRRALHGAGLPRDRDELRRVLSDHSAGANSLCAHADPSDELGHRWETLAVASLDVRRGELWVLPGTPCGDSGWARCSSSVAVAA